MNPVSFSKKLKKIIALAIVIATTLNFTSCDRLHENLQPCPQGVRLRFVYDYNMEFANAFPSQVDCLTLLIYDQAGRYVGTRTAFPPETADENWRMTIDLPAGKYHFEAYGGISCDKSSFDFLTTPAQTTLTELQVALNPSFLTSPEGKALHHLYWGDLEIEVPEFGDGTDYTEDTLYMKKDTNDIRVLLANLNNTPINEEDFEFRLITDNTLLDYKNDIVQTEETTYWPWSHGNLSAGVLPNGQEATFAYAEISTSRLVKGNPTTLLITRKKDGKEVVKVPLINILLLYKSDRYPDMQPQEFLDRESRWNVTFLITGDDVWMRATIVVNDWIVRYNNAEF
ncbi:MAG: FimB/Mfa2 family fimbrial subunit [Muribaculaceae bacterium]|nr:FimB/Mfa2 family fimbrial subunit [Muribaculaceae bacterium]